MPVGPAPVTGMARASVLVPVEGGPPVVDSSPSAPPPFARWRAYGVALFDQQRYEEAAGAFERALTLASSGSGEEVPAWTDLAMACLRMERAGSSHAALERAERALDRALALDPANARARYLRAMLGVKRFRYTEALRELGALAEEYPRDRHVWERLGWLHLLQRRDGEARAAHERVLEVDPDDTEAHMRLTGLAWRFGEAELAARKQIEFEGRHADTAGETLRREYLRAHPELYATWPWRSFGDNPIGSQP